ncbi:hypothetical protein C0992_012142, partial [Termitomyces sp. T32_za158]
MTISVAKTKWTVFGSLPASIDPVFINGDIIEHVDSYKYVGLLFSRGSLFLKHYIAKSEKAQRVANVTFAVHTHIGVIPPFEGKRLYMARIDPQLTFGCEVVLDTVASSLTLLENVQVAYCRRLLGLGSRATLAPLFTETGILPLRYRRAILATKYLLYLLNLPTNHYASSALHDSIALARDQKSSWARDLAHVLEGLSLPGSDATSVKTPVHLQWNAPLDSDMAGNLEDDIKAACYTGLQQVVNSSTKLHLIRARQSSSRPPPISDFRSYLSVPTPAHRRALARLMASDHPFAVERLRHGDRRRPHG